MVGNITNVGTPSHPVYVDSVFDEFQFKWRYGE